MIIVGIDLSGPSNSAETALVAFESSLRGGLSRCRRLQGADDGDILACVSGLRSRGDLVVGLDAPLSYQMGGGDRPGDADLRRTIVALGLQPGSVMPPTLTRMAYLTLRGMSVARLLIGACEKIAIVEVHPGAAMALRGAPITDVIGFKQQAAARWNLLAWMQGQGLAGVGDTARPSDHYVAACAAALAAWRWRLNDAAWICRAVPPHHPFDYAC